MTASYCCLWFLPTPKVNTKITSIDKFVYHLNNTVYVKHVDNTTDNIDKYSCHWNCLNRTDFYIWLTHSDYISTVYVNASLTNNTCNEYDMKFNANTNNDVVCEPKDGCYLICKDEDLNLDETLVDAFVNTTAGNKTKRSIGEQSVTIESHTNESVNDLKESLVKTTLSPSVREEFKEENGGKSFYVSSTFWGYVVLMCVGTVAFNVANCISDAICFNVLGKLYFYIFNHDM